MPTLVPALLLALQPASPPAAAQVKASYRAHRAPSCSEWSTVRTGRGALPLLEAAYNIWFHGYVSGFNIHGPDPAGDLLGSTQWREVGAFIDDHCARNPARPVADALQPLVAHLIERRPMPAGPGPKRRARLTVTTTCAEWNQQRGDKLLRLVSGGAVRGYLTAYNRWGPDPAGDIIGQGNDALIDEWIDKWCGRRPSAMLMQAVPPLIRHFASERAAGRLAPGGTPSNDQVIPIPPDRR